MRKVLCPVIRRRLHSKGNHPAGQSLCNLRKLPDPVADHKRPVLRKKLCKSAERPADILQILEKVQMVCINI